MILRLFFTVMTTATLAMACPARVNADASVLCETAARKVAAETGVPVSVLAAISLTETGRKQDGAMRPWPWTVNMEGKGVWFETAEAAEAYVLKNYQRGARSFDVGCFQLNYRWHGKNFASIHEMFQPETNARYAAKFLTELFQEKGDWSMAAGAYHSRTKQYADRYRQRFDRFRTAALNDTPPRAMAKENDRVAKPSNRFPLLVRSETAGRMGSLVPLGRASVRSLFDPNPGQG